MVDFSDAARKQADMELSKIERSRTLPRDSWRKGDDWGSLLDSEEGTGARFVVVSTRAVTPVHTSVQASD